MVHALGIYGPPENTVQEFALKDQWAFHAMQAVLRHLSGCLCHLPGVSMSNWLLFKDASGWLNWKKNTMSAFTSSGGPDDNGLTMIKNKAEAVRSFFVFSLPAYPDMRVALEARERNRSLRYPI